MGAWDKLRQTGDYLRKLRLSLGPDSYFHYKREKKYERKRADRAREHAERSADQEREAAQRGRDKAERERGYEERYARELEGDVAPERTERADESEADR
jgi:hypothetical protein